MKLTFLGTGTSFGVPVIGCSCEVCRSSDSKDKRFRTSALLESDNRRILIDCGPDLRQQLIPLPFRKIDAVLLTHHHYDHVGGMDDLRPFCQFGDIHIYGNEFTINNVRHNFPYCFVKNPYPGVPRICTHTLTAGQTADIADIHITPIEVMHGKMPILGYRFGSAAYITDMKTISPQQAALLQGVKTLIVNGLRWTDDHPAHLLITEAIRFSQQIGAATTYLTHMTHRIGLHHEAQQRLPQGIYFAYDGLCIDLD